MRKWASMLAILFVLTGGLALSACEPPEDIEEDDLDNSMDNNGEGDDW